MKKHIAVLLSLLLAVGMTACGGSNTDSTSKPSGSAGTSEQVQSPSEEETRENADSESVQDGGKALVAYFAYSENVGDTSSMEIDAITSASLNRETSNTEGNLQVMAQVIEEKKAADVFHILMTEPYPMDYSTMLPISVEQMQNEDWPALQSKIENLEEYDVIYIGVPVWNSVLPPAMNTFFAENDLSGKTIVPFGIHLGSRFGRMIEQMKELAPGATVTDGFTINAETDNDEVKTEFGEWLDALVLNP